MGSRGFTQGRVIVARLPHDADLLEAVAAVADEQGITTADVRGIGALKRARLAYYDQSARTYGELAVDQPVELVSLTGNVSRREGRTAVHVHAALADREGRTWGGHVQPGCVVFAGELVLTELVGESLERVHDETTGLPLWRGL